MTNLPMATGGPELVCRLCVAALSRQNPVMPRTSRLLGWLLLAALIFATLAPIGLRPVSGAPVSLERFGAFAVLGFLFACGCPHRRWQVLVVAILAAGGLEALQLIDPTRHGRIGDFLVKAAGVGFGVVAAVAMASVPALSRRVPQAP